MQQVVYPNQIHVPLMENSGLPKPPVGMLEITVIRASGLRTGDTFSKGDPYVRISVQERKLPEDDEEAADGAAAAGKSGAAAKVRLEDEVVVLKEHPSHQTVHHKNTKNPEFNEHFKVRLATSRASFQSEASLRSVSRRSVDEFDVFCCGEFRRVCARRGFDTRASSS